MCSELIAGLQEKGHVVVAIPPKPLGRLGRSLVARFVRETLRLPLMLRRSLVAGRCDAVAVYSPPFVLCFAALALGAWWGAPTIIWLQDLHPRLAEEIGLIRNRFVLVVAYALERLAYRWATRIVVIGEGYRQHCLAMRAEAWKIHVIENWAFG